MSKQVIPLLRNAVIAETRTGEANSDTLPTGGGKDGARDERWVVGRYALCEQKVDGGGGGDVRLFK